jgi:hypothetical protein
MFDKFSLPDLARVSRRTVLGALIIGVGGLVVTIVLNAPLVGLGLCVGLALGILNFRMVQRSVAKVGARADDNHRRPLALNTLGRLALVSVIALGLLFVSFDLGLGVMAGLAAFEFLLLFNVARSMMRMGPGLLSLDGDVVDADVIEAGSVPSLDEPGQDA